MLTTKPIKGKGKYMDGKLKTWKEHIKMNVCITMKRQLQVESAYKPAKTSIRQYILRSVNTFIKKASNATY